MNRRSFIKNSTIMVTGTLVAGMIPSGTGAASVKSARSIYRVINASGSSMGSLQLKKIINGDYQNYVSPFFIVDEFGPMSLPAGAPFRVDAHPHAGIIPTTYLLAGNAHHRDSLDNDFQYHEGDFIQFTSGSGALHMEETGDGLYKHGGTFHGMQAWLNIPPLLKKSSPSASRIQKQNIPIIKSDGSVIRVIMGGIGDIKSETELLMPVIYWHVSMQKDTVLKLPVDQAQNAFIYILKGLLEAKDGVFVQPGQTILYERDGDHILIKAKEDSDFLVLGGEVNNQLYVANGPFVLNSEQEIQQAYIDFQAGKFGDLAKTNGTRRP